MSPASDRLRGLVAGVRRHLRNRSVLAALCWAGGGILVLWLAAWALVEPEGWRQGSDVPVLIVTTMALWVLAAVIGARLGIVRWFGEVRVSGAMERAARLRVGEVRGALELVRAMPPGVSASLAGHAAERAARDLGAHSVGSLSGDLGDAVNLWTRRGLAFLTAAVLLVVGLGVLAPARTAHAWAGLVSPLATMADPEFMPLVVTPGTAEVVRGADVEVRIEAEGRTTVELAWQATGDVQRVERLDVVDGRAAHVIRGVSAETEYRVRGDVGAATELFRLVPVDPLFVGDLLIGIEYPPHTGLPEEEHRMSVPVLRLPVGTVVTFAGRANRTLAAADLVRDSGAVELRLDVAGAEFGARWTPREDGTYDWRFRDAEGEAAVLLPDPLRVELVPDQPPSVRIPVPGADTLLPLDLRQPLVIEAADDYGLGSLELVAHRVTAIGQRQEPVIQRLDLEGTRGAMARPVLDVSDWNLMPGDTVRYFARVTDNAPRGQVAVSPEYVLRMPSAGDMRREVERSLEAVADRVEALSGEAGRQAEENRARAREGETRRDPQQGRSGSNEESGRAFEEREAMRQALEEQEGLSEEVEAMLSELGEMERAMENAGQADPALREQLRELQELLQEAAGDDLGERMQQLAESLERQDPSAARRSLEEMAREQELLRERLEESLDRFRRAAVEQDFRATTSEAEELARQEQALADALREDADPAERAQQQEELAGRAEDLEGSLERLQERLREMDEQAAAEGVAEAANRAERAEAGMREAGRQANEGEQQEAAEQADQAAQQMSEAARQLQEAQQEMAEQKTQAAKRALQQTSDDALALARRQAELRAQMRGAGRERISGMRGEEASLLQGLQNMAENLRVATEGQVPDGRGISEQMGRAMQSLQRTIDAMERPRSLSGSPMAEAERVVAELNELALKTLASADQMGQDGQGQQQGAEQDMQEALENLAQEQGSLANDAGQVVPMQLGQQAMAEQAQQLAQGQQAVSDRLGELSDMPSSEGALGDLEQFAAEAADLAAELATGRLTPETAQRQERLFHRLLDAGRSLEQEEFSEERESESAGAFERAEVSPLDPSQLGVMPYRLPDSEQLRALSPGVRQLILDYFERLNREGPAQDGGRR